MPLRDRKASVDAYSSCLAADESQDIDTSVKSYLCPTNSASTTGTHLSTLLNIDN